MIEDQKFLKSDSLIKYHNIWEDAINSETSPLTIKSRSISNSYDYDYYKLQGELQDSVCSWMLRMGHEIVPTYGTLTGDPDIDNQAWEESKQSIWPLFENEWSQLTIGLKINGHNTVQHKVESITDKWTEYYNKVFPILKEYDENGNSSEFIPQVGSGALAAGRIMHFYRHPNHITWDKFDENDSRENEYISSFLYHLCLESNADFKRNHTVISCFNLEKVINSYGYNTNIYTKFNKTTIAKNIPCILYGNLNYKGAAKYSHYVIVSGYSELYYENKSSIWTFTDPHWFRECWTHSNHYGSTRYKVNWCRNSFNNDGWFDLEATMRGNTDNPKSISFTGIITLTPK